MVAGWSLVGVRSDIGVQNVQKILFGANKRRSHKTSRSHIRGSFVAGTTVYDDTKLVNGMFKTLIDFFSKYTRSFTYY